MAASATVAEDSAAEVASEAVILVAVASVEAVVAQAVAASEEGDDDYLLSKDGNFSKDAHLLGN